MPQHKAPRRKRILFSLKLALGFSVFPLLYILFVYIVLNVFLSDLVFMRVEAQPTREDSRFKVSSGSSEVLVREYRAQEGKHCVVFFPGRSGGIARYEEELFEPILSIGFSVYAISLPGYEGANGKATYQNVMELVPMALERINNTSSCRISESVFVGRSLGAAIAVDLAAANTPAGIIGDSIVPSLSEALEAQFRELWFLKPATYLPLESFMSFNLNAAKSISALDLRVVVLQGTADELAPYHALKAELSSITNLQLIAVEEADHSTAHILGRSNYLRELKLFFEQNSPR